MLLLDDNDFIINKKQGKQKLTRACSLARPAKLEVVEGIAVADQTASLLARRNKAPPHYSLDAILPLDCLSGVRGPDDILRPQTIKLVHELRICFSNLSMCPAHLQKIQKCIIIFNVYYGTTINLIAYPSIRSKGTHRGFILLPHPIHFLRIRVVVDYGACYGETLVRP